MKALTEHGEGSEDTLWQALRVVGHKKENLSESAKTNILSAFKYDNGSSPVYLATDMSGVLLDNKKVLVVVPSTKEFYLTQKGGKYIANFLDGTSTEISDVPDEEVTLDGNGDGVNSLALSIGEDISEALRRVNLTPTI